MNREVKEKVVIRLIGKFFNGCCCEKCHQDYNHYVGYPRFVISLSRNRYAEVCRMIEEAYYKWLEHKNIIQGTVV
jgi:hypothetical protein